MSMTPREIHEKHFHDAFRGYNHEEVDTFLDEVAEAFERLYKDNQNLLRRVAELQEQVNRSPEGPVSPMESDQEDLVSESLLKRMLVMAQETADKAVYEARQKAHALVEKAQARAHQIEEEARAAAGRTVEDAEKAVVRLEESAAESRRELDQARSGLRRFEEEYRAQFRLFIESQLEALNRMPSPPEGPGSGSGLENTQAAVMAPPPDGDELSSDKLPEAVGGFSEPGPRTETGQASGNAGSRAPASGNSPKTPESVAAVVSRRPAGDQVRPDASAPGQGGSQPRGPGKPAAEDDADEDRLIRELFWGEE